MAVVRSCLAGAQDVDWTSNAASSFRALIQDVEADVAQLGADIADLEEMARAGLLRIEPGRIVVQSPGRMLVRAISMVFDARLRANRPQNRYSKVI